MEDNNNIFKKYNQWVAGILLLFIFTTMIICTRRKVLKIKNDMGITSGKIVKVESAYRGGADFTYEFRVDSNIYIHPNVDVSFTRGEGQDLLYKFFPVVYRSTN